MVAGELPAQLQAPHSREQIACRKPAYVIMTVDSGLLNVLLIPLLAECPSIWFTTAPSDEIGTPGSDVEFSCAVNADVAIVWYIPGYLPPKKNDTEYGCNTDHSECNSTLRVRNVTEDMNQMSFQCIALHGRITGDSVYSRAALLTGIVAINY